MPADGGNRAGCVSAHAGQSELLQWFAPLAPTQPRVVLNHGEDHKGRRPLADKNAQRFGLKCELPQLGEVIELG